MTTEKPIFWKISARPGQWIGIEEVDTIPSTLVLGLHDVGMNDVYQHIVELHNASEIQRTTGWYTIPYPRLSGTYWMVRDCHGHDMPCDFAEQGFQGAFGSPAKAIIAAWEFIQNQQRKEVCHR